MPSQAPWSDEVLARVVADIGQLVRAKGPGSGHGLESGGVRLASVGAKVVGQDDRRAPVREPERRDLGRLARSGAVGDDAEPCPSGHKSIEEGDGPIVQRDRRAVCPVPLHQLRGRDALTEVGESGTQPVERVAPDP